MTRLDPSRQWRCRRKPSTSKHVESLQSEEDQQSKINSTQRRATGLTTLLNSIHQFKIPAHMLNQSRSRTRDQQRYQRSEELSANQKLSWWISWTLQRAISIIEKETAKNVTFLQKEIDTRNTNKRHSSAHHKGRP